MASIYLLLIGYFLYRRRGGTQFKIPRNKIKGFNSLDNSVIEVVFHDAEDNQAVHEVIMSTEQFEQLQTAMQA